MIISDCTQSSGGGGGSGSGFSSGPRGGGGGGGGGTCYVSAQATLMVQRLIVVQNCGGVGHYSR